MPNKAQRQPSRAMYHQPLLNSNAIINRHKNDKKELEDAFEALVAGEFDGPIDYDGIEEESNADFISRLWLRNNGFNVDLIDAADVEKQWTKKYKAADQEHKKELYAMQDLLKLAGYWPQKHYGLCGTSLANPWGT